jgi:hypothetical protein
MLLATIAFAQDARRERRFARPGQRHRAQIARAEIHQGLAMPGTRAVDPARFSPGCCAARFNETICWARGRKSHRRPASRGGRRRRPLLLKRMTGFLSSASPASAGAAEVLVDRTGTEFFALRLFFRNVVSARKPLIAVPRSARNKPSRHAGQRDFRGRIAAELRRATLGRS